MIIFCFIPENFTSSDCEVAAAMIRPNRENLMLEIFSPRNVVEEMKINVGAIFCARSC